MSTKSRRFDAEDAHSRVEVGAYYHGFCDWITRGIGYV